MEGKLERHKPLCSSRKDYVSLAPTVKQQFALVLRIGILFGAEDAVYDASALQSFTKVALQFGIRLRAASAFWECEA